MLTAAGERPSARDPVAARFNDGLPKWGKRATQDRERITAENLLRSGHRQVTGKYTQGTSDQLTPASRAIDSRDRLDDPEKGHRINLRPAERLRYPEAEQTCARHRLDQWQRQPAAPFAFFCKRRNLRCETFRCNDERAQQIVGHRSSPGDVFATRQRMPFTPLAGDEVGPKSSEPIRKFPKPRSGWRLASSERRW